MKRGIFGLVAGLLLSVMVPGEAVAVTTFGSDLSGVSSGGFTTGSSTVAINSVAPGAVAPGGALHRATEWWSAGESG